MKKSGGLNVAVVGATGAVGKQVFSILKQRGFPVKELRAFASSRSVGKVLEWSGRTLTCEALAKGCFAGIDVVFFDASDEVSQEWVPEAASAGAWVVDNSAAFRMASDISLMVPEVNGALLDERLARSNRGEKLDWRERVVAGPNCSTVQLVVPLQAIQARWGLKRVVVSSYQSVSGAGAAAMDELSEQAASVLDGKPAAPRIFTHQIAFNCIPQIGGFKGDGYTSEEKKIIDESRKILGLPGLRVTATAVRVPTFSCHAESVNIETERPFEISEVRRALEEMPGIRVIDDPSKGRYPLNVTAPGDSVEQGTGNDPVYVGRIRRDDSLENGLNLWVVSDNLRKGAALNAIQIGEVIARALL